MPSSTDLVFHSSPLLLQGCAEEQLEGKQEKCPTPSCTGAPLISLLLPDFLDLTHRLLPLPEHPPLRFTGHSSSPVSAALQGC